MRLQGFSIGFYVRLFCKYELIKDLKHEEIQIKSYKNSFID